MSTKTSASTKRRRTWTAAALGLALIALLGFGLRPRPAPVETARVVLGSLRATVSEEGKTRIRQRYIVSSPVSGQLRRIPLKPGAAVDANEVLAVIEPMAASPLDARSRALAEARRDTANAALEKSRLSHELAAKELQRMRQLREGRGVSAQDLETTQQRETAAARELVASEGELRQAEAELAAAGSESPGAAPIAPVELRSPVAGRVLRVYQESERPVTAGAPLLEIGNPVDLEVVIELLSRDGAAIAPGAQVELEQWGGPQPLEARVRLIEPVAFTKISALGVEEQRVYVVADILSPLEQRAQLGDNFRVEARVVVWQSDRVLKLPVSGLFRRGSEWAAFVVREGRARLVSVKAGRSSGSEIQVLEGLKEGDEVILYPGDRVKEGQSVTPIKV
ncbi:MAG: efflux RND transporter periplasmic adaptor subunit [Opitutaceae bacterium]|jgi:HlyD family secretion protein